MDLTNRDIALIVWLAALVAVLLARRDTRSSIRGVLRAFWGKVAVLFAAYAIYVALAVALAQDLGGWNVGLLKDTIAWFLVPGTVLLFGFTKAYESRGFYGPTLVRVIGLTALAEFYVNLAAFDLWVELLLLPVVVLLSTTSVVAGMKAETQIAKRFLDRLLMTLGLLVLLGSGAYVAGHWDTLDKAELALSFFLPIWLTIVTLPFVFAFSLFANYEVTFVRIDLFSGVSRRARRRAKLALLATFGLRNRELHRFVGVAPQELAQAASWGEARRIIAFRRAETRVEEAKKDLAAKRLMRYAGVEGEDWEGRPYDRREFAETKAALERLWLFQRSQHEQHGRYNLALDVGILVGERLPAEHGIVMTVGPKGRSWFAWRTTVTGWCFGIGATGAPPDEWSWEGREPPVGPPSSGTMWTHGAWVDEDDAD